MTESEQIASLQKVISALIPHFQMLLDRSLAHDFIIYELLRLQPTGTNQMILDAFQSEISSNPNSSASHKAAAEIVSLAMSGVPPKKNMRDILKVIPGGKFDS
ncbi:MAG: hypothetical protein WBI04_04630 [Trichlorobacter sp.]